MHSNGSALLLLDKYMKCVCVFFRCLHSYSYFFFFLSSTALVHSYSLRCVSRATAMATGLYKEFGKVCGALIKLKSCQRGSCWRWETIQPNSKATSQLIWAAAGFEASTCIHRQRLHTNPPHPCLYPYRAELVSAEITCQALMCKLTNQDSVTSMRPGLVKVFICERSLRT